LSRADEIIGSLAGYPDAGVDPDVHIDGDGTFDGPDKTLDEPIDSTELRAVPEGVVDEQLETIEKVQAEKDKVESPKEKVDETDWENVARGRLGQIDSLRESGRQQSANIESLRRMWLADAQEKQKVKADAQRVEELNAERKLYGDEVVDDPGARYLRDKMQQTQEVMERNRQHAEYQQRVVQEQSAAYDRQVQAQNQALDQLDVMEKEMSEKHADYFEAYKFAVDKRADMYIKRGYTKPEAEMAVRNEEAYLFSEQMQRGGNPAQVAYDMAKQWGWKSEAEDVAKAKPDTEKLKASVGAGGLGQMSGQSGHSSDSRYLTQEEFFNTVPEQVRLQVLADQEKFEELGRTGKIKITW
jgi:hypothetical protein